MTQHQLKTSTESNPRLIPEHTKTRKKEEDKMVETIWREEENNEVGDLVEEVSRLPNTQSFYHIHGAMKLTH